MPERIYRGTLLVLWDTQTVCLRTNHRGNTAADKQSVLHGGPFFFFFFFTETLLWYTVIVLMCWHPKVLVQRWLNSPSAPITPHNLSYRPASSAKSRLSTAAKLSSHHRTTFSAQSEMVLKKSSHLTFWFAFICFHSQLHNRRFFCFYSDQNPSAEAVARQHKGELSSTWSYLQGSFATRWGPGLGWR